MALTPNDGDLLKPQEVSKLLNVAVQTLANWRSLGIGPSFQKLSPTRSGRVRYRRADVLLWLAEAQKRVAA